MTIKDRIKRNEKIIEFLKEHTLLETAIEFNLSVGQIFRIKKDNQ